MRLYNTLTKKKEDFEPLSPGEVKLYTCGPTVYDYIHIGNVRAYFSADVLRRTLEGKGLQVTHIKNITDVGHLTEDDLAQGDSGEDKIEKKARLEKKTPAQIAEFYTDYFHATEKSLNILPAHAYPKATENIPGMITLIEKLIASGNAYAVNGNVYFDVTSFADYGKLSGNTLEHLKVGARLEKHPDKRHPWDFALWLKAPAGHILHWPSPWSEGYPGWHIECSAMSLSTLGETLDIHTGGEDNIFPHHEAEIAQSECANDGKQFVRYWIHTRHLLVDGEKMSKSKGNFYKLEDIEKKGYSPMDLRMLFLGSHYRSQMNFTWESLEQAKKNKEALFNTHNRLKNVTLSEEMSFKTDLLFKNFMEALYNDLNTPLAVTHVLTIAKNINIALDKMPQYPIHPEVLKQFEKILSIFGLKEEVIEIPGLVKKLVNERETARKKKDFAHSDTLRNEIEKHGFTVEDTPTGQKVRKF